MGKRWQGKRGLSLLRGRTEMKGEGKFSSLNVSRVSCSSVSPRQKKPKTPPAIAEGFPADETPTPTRILKMADMDLFGELKVQCHSSLAHSFIRRETFSRIPPASTVGKKTPLMLTSERQRKQLNKAKTFKRTSVFYNSQAFPSQFHLFHSRGRQSICNCDSPPS